RDAHSERRVKHRATDPFYEGEQGQEKVARDRLVLARRHRQDLHRTLGELNETICLVSESKVLLISPESLQRQGIYLQPIGLPHQFEPWDAYTKSHTSLPIDQSRACASEYQG